MTGELGTKERKNLMVVGKVLQKAFNLKTFGKNEKLLVPLNTFIDGVRDDLVKYFNNLVQVPDPEDFLQVDQYNEMTQKEKPVIIISLTELASIHRKTHRYIHTSQKTSLVEQGPTPYLTRAVTEMLTCGLRLNH